MLILYAISLAILHQLYKVAAWFNPKAKAFLQGRQRQVALLEKTFPLSGTEKLVWIHCASLGEFEQGRPIIESIKSQYPAVKILLTFFSPSGYEVRKNYAFADYVFYLPWDSRKNAKRFIEKVNPATVIFVKYEFWYFYAHEIHKRNIPLLSISSIFRPGQIFFMWYGSLFRSILKCFTHFFVQNNESVELLRSIGITGVTLSGDSRFDRVRQIIEQGGEVSLAKEFKGQHKAMVVGSAWPEDMDILYPFINENKGKLKFIIAPHEISERFIAEIERSLEGKCVRYSKATQEDIQMFSVLIIDNVGMLTRLYRYGDFAFVGGGFGQGLHNILEAACYGIPIFFGNKTYQKYQEANDLIHRGGAFEIGGYPELKRVYEKLTNHPASLLLANEVTRQYVLENLGATDKIVNYCKKFLGQ